LTITFGGFQLQVCATGLECRFNGPTLGLVRHNLLRRHGDSCAKERLVTMGPCTLMDVHPADRNQVLPDTVPVSCARDHLDVSGTSPTPGHREAGALGRVRHDCVGGREFLAFHTRAPHGVTRARGRRFVQGGVTITLADPCAMTPVWATKPCSRTGARARIPHKDALALWKPAHHAGQEESGEMCRRFMAPPMGLIPIWIAIQGHQHRERPGPDRTRKLDQHRQDDPRRSPPICCRAVGRAHTIAMASRAEDVGARTFCDRLIPSQPYGSCRHHSGQPKGEPPASQLPGRPTSRRKHPVIGGNMPLGVMTHRTADSRDGLATSRSEGSEPQHEEPVIRRGGKSRLKPTQYWDREIG